MNGTWTAITVVTCILACAGTCILIWYMAWHDGYEAGRDAEKDRQARKRLRETTSDALIRAKTGSEGAPPWYVTVTPRHAYAVPGVPLTAITGTVPPSRPATDTGELRALTNATDLYVGRITAEGDAYRQEMTA